MSQEGWWGLCSLWCCASSPFSPLCCWSSGMLSHLSTAFIFQMQYVINQCGSLLHPFVQERVNDARWFCAGTLTLNIKLKKRCDMKNINQTPAIGNREAAFPRTDYCKGFLAPPGERNVGCCQRRYQNKQTARSCDSPAHERVATAATKGCHQLPS